MDKFFSYDADSDGTKGLVYIGDMLLVSRRDEKAPKAPLLIDVPGGGAEPNETPFDTFQREVKEEFGLSISEKDIVYAKKYHNSSGDQSGYFAVAKLPPDAEHDIKFGDEGLGFMLMSEEEYLGRDDAWVAYQHRAKEYMQQ